MSRRKRHQAEMLYIGRMFERANRVQEDVFWAVWRDHAARAAQMTHEAREGTPWWAYRILDCTDEPSLRPVA